MKSLERKLGHQFNDSSLLTLALTHRSRGNKNYERLEFLGDSILGFVVADWLINNFTEQSEGKLSRMRSSLVRKETLAKVARSLNLSDHLIMGEGELKSGGFNRDSILSDSVESIIGALYLDAGLETAKRFILENFSQELKSIRPDSHYKDAKSRLQEAMQKVGYALPTYSLVATAGQQHEQQFTVSCKLNELPIEEVAIAGNRRLAEQQSAEKVLEKLRGFKGFASV